MPDLAENPDAPTVQLIALCEEMARSWGGARRSHPGYAARDLRLSEEHVRGWIERFEKARAELTEPDRCPVCHPTGHDSACRGLFQVGETVWHRDFGRCVVAETPEAEPPGIVYVTQGGRTVRTAAGMLGRMTTREAR